MSSRYRILDTVRNNQPTHLELPTLPAATPPDTGDLTRGKEDLTPAFLTALETIGAAGYIVTNFGGIATILREQFPQARRIVTSCPQLAAYGEAADKDIDPHTLENVDLAILPAHFGVAENGACWITETQMVQRVLPFIAQHLALVIHRRDIVANMHAAYEHIGALEAAAPYGFATFIAGPSKTADIEQSLVLGAHGPMSLTVFLLDETP
jgi:L-lactate dehydrogenase complex protein LldG